jgi:HEAT repeat protein
MRFIMRCTLPLAGLVLLLPALRAQDDETDKVVRGKRASEWVVILRSGKEVVQRRQALLALEIAGPQTRKVFDEIGSALRLDDVEVVRVGAAHTLGRLGAKAVERMIPVKPAVDALMASLNRDKSATVREAAADALGRLARTGTEPVSQFTADARPAIATLGAALKDDSLAVRAAAGRALARMGPPAKEVLPALIQAVRDSKGKEQTRVRLGAVSAIQRIGRPDGLPAVEALLDVVKESEPTNVSPEERKEWMEVRLLVVETLGVLGDVAAQETLKRTLDRALQAKEPELGRAAITALTQLAGNKKELVPTLVNAMAPPPTQLQDRFIRCEAMHAISQLGRDLDSYRKPVVEHLRKALGDKLSEVRLAAILALGELGPDVLGDETKPIVAQLQVLRRASEKSIAEAAEATIKRLEKQ